MSYDNFLITPKSVSVVGLDCFHIFMGNCIQRLWKEMILSFGDQTGIHYKELKTNLEYAENNL